METKRTAWVLTLAGAIPFAVLSLSLFVLPQGDPLLPIATRAFLTYGAVILSFLGGIRWGLALRDGSEAQTLNLALSVLPSLAGWIAIMFPPLIATVMLAFAFPSQLAWDLYSAKRGAFPPWFVSLRVVITAIVTICLLIAAIAFS